MQDDSPERLVTHLVVTKQTWHLPDAIPDLILCSFLPSTPHSLLEDILFSLDQMTQFSTWGPRVLVEWDCQLSLEPGFV